MNEPQNNDQNMPMTTPESLYGEKHHSHLGPILGVLIIMLVLILGGLYLWGGMLSKEAATDQDPIVNNEPETPRAEADMEIMGTVSSSDELSAIEADVESTNLDSLDSDLTAAEAELDAAYSE